ncbi:MAG: PqqD family protein [Niabella sp.]|nr:PqqD family protein [Niabella sp.]
MSYKLNTKDVLITNLGDEGVAFNSVTNEYFSLNETSYKILKGIENDLSSTDICEQLRNEYSISPSDCEKAVNNTLQIFLARKLVIEE